MERHLEGGEGGRRRERRGHFGGLLDFFGRVERRKNAGEKAREVLQKERDGGSGKF